MVSAGLTEKMLIDAEEATTNMTVSEQSWAAPQSTVCFYYSQWKHLTEPDYWIVKNKIH